MKVEVSCCQCMSSNEDGDIELIEMEGADKLFENTEAGTQSRKYTCPRCLDSVYVLLINEASLDHP